MRETWGVEDGSLSYSLISLVMVADAVSVNRNWVLHAYPDPEY